MQIFIGLETINKDNLAEATKGQNKVQQYPQLVDSLREHNIVAHMGYIIGFPHDSLDSVTQDVDKLMKLADMVTFFILTPLHGSEFYAQAWKLGSIISNDLNEFDSFQPVMQHPIMSTQE